MNREQFEQLLADALGDELTPDNRVIFERCLDEHPDWRQEYESARHTLGALVSLTSPPQMTARREGNRLVFEAADQPAATPVSRRTVSAWHRYAAVILIAFTAGYAMHAVLLMNNAVRPAQDIVQSTAPTSMNTVEHHSEPTNPDRTTSFRMALVDAHRRKPSRSGLANCLIAMGGQR